MATTASSQTERTRPSSRLKPQSLLESTPVLFRLPTIQAPELSRAAVESEDPSFPLFSSDVVKESISMDTNGGHLAQQLAQQSAAQPMGQPSISARQDEEAAIVDPNPSPRRSWWEHWSSGVVLIVLAIALLSAIIVLTRQTGDALQGSRDSGSIEDDFGDLEMITVPTIQLTSEDESVFPTETRLAAGPVSQRSEASGGSSVTASESGSNQVSDLAAQLANTDVQPFENQTSTNPSQPTTAGLDPAAHGASAAMAAVQLMDPTTHPADLATQENNPALPELPDMDGLSERPVSTQLGGSPSLYDEATTAGESGWDPMNSQNEGASVAANQPLGSMDEPAAGGSGPMASSMPNIAAAKSSVPSMATTVSTAGSAGTTGSASTTGSSRLDAAKTGQPSSSSAPNIRVTATPESNEEEIIRAYLELIRGGAQQRTGDTQNNNVPSSSAQGSSAQGSNVQGNNEQGNNEQGNNGQGSESERINRYQGYR
jgi:hypothetical protein